MQISGGVQLSGGVNLTPGGSDPTPGGGGFQGSNFGYTSGGSTNPPSVMVNTIDKFSFSADGNATDVGDLTEARSLQSGQSSADNGYTSGGVSYNGSFTRVDIIDKFPFSSDANATDVGNLTQNIRNTAGQSSNSNGYASGGQNTPSSPVASSIDKFPFSSDSNATDAGDLTLARVRCVGQSSDVSGYTSGGYAGGGTNVIDKFPFASDANATDVGDLSRTAEIAAGQSSSSSGYTSGGEGGGPSGYVAYGTTIDKFSFSSDSNGSDVGDLTLSRSSVVGQSSTASGYTSGGIPGVINVIDKFPFASDGNATDVGDLTEGRSGSAGQQY
jgi:hypothetical protein